MSPTIDTAHVATWTIVALAILGVIAHPFKWPEAVWAVAGAVLLVVPGLLSPAAAWYGVRKGLDVYLFLVGMMALAAVARREGLFDWLASLAVRGAKGSASRLFLLVYGVGIIVTTFLSNDATAVVLTPAVYAAAKAAKAEPLPYLFICALIANAASFVLPISNPANLVVFASHMPPLGQWLRRFGVASIASILVTFVVLRWSQRARLREPIEADVEAKPLPTSGKVAGAGIILTGIALVASSALDFPLGPPTFIAGLLTVALVLVMKRDGPWTTVRDIGRIRRSSLNGEDSGKRRGSLGSQEAGEVKHQWEEVDEQGKPPAQEKGQDKEKDDDSEFHSMPGSPVATPGERKDDFS